MELGTSKAKYMTRENFFPKGDLFERLEKKVKRSKIAKPQMSEEAKKGKRTK
jgi:hypothetical protein